jgi:hypothetical protein
MEKGKLYRTLTELILHREDFQQITLGDLMTDSNLALFETISKTSRKPVSRPLSLQDDLRANHGVELPSDVLLGASLCVVPAGSVVMFLENSDRTRNMRLVYGEFVGWTDLLTDKPVLSDVVAEDENG